jgi:galactokinase
MNEKEFFAKIDSVRTAELFKKLYGESGTGTAIKRYRKLIGELLKDASNEFSESEDMRLFSAPGRTELAGNHTDHNMGKVLAASIQLDNVAVVQGRKDNTIFFRSAGYPDVKVKLTDSSGASDLQPKTEEEGKTEALVRGITAEFFKRMESHEQKRMTGFSANAVSTVLPGSGLSSSAAVEVLFGRIIDSLYSEGKRSSTEIAQIGQIAENVYFKKPCGLMDQIACASGNAVAIDFADSVNPKVRQVNFDLTSAGYTLCVVNTGGSHADLTSDYASIPAEMKKVAAFFGKPALGGLEKETVISQAAEIRKKFGDRALLRSMHFFNENERVDAMIETLVKMENAGTHTEKQQALLCYLDMVNESGDSSWELLQNVYSFHNPEAQGISAALALSKSFFRRQKLHGSCRVHGGGFAGTIQAYVPLDSLDKYSAYMENVFGKDSVTVLRIRPLGAVELTF